MTNYDHWMYWCSELPTTDRFVQACWVSMISSALQRRVWMGSSNNPVYANQYILEIARPGVGKSLPITECRKMLEHHKLRSGDDDADDDARPDKLMFPVAADSTSYQAFMRELASNPRVAKDETGQKHRHMSVSFFLDEATSILHSEAEQMVDLLNKGWSCSSAHKHDAISTKYAPIKNMCINLIGGTQPDKFARINKVDVVSSGFTRRALLVYGAKNRFEQPLIPEPTEAQYESKKIILAHLLKLATLWGRAHFTAEAWDRFSTWWKDPVRDTKNVNRSPRLANYYVSKNLHVIKMAMAIHFGESTSTEIGLGPLEAAFDLLREWETDMHLCYTGNQDKFADIKNMTEAALKSAPHPLSLRDLYSPFLRDLNVVEFRQVLDDMMMSGICEMKESKYVAIK